LEGPVFYADRKSKMAATTGHSINTEPYGENTEIYSSLKLLHCLNLNCASIIGRSFTNFVFFMLIVIPRWRRTYFLHRTNWFFLLPGERYRLLRASGLYKVESPFYKGNSCKYVITFALRVLENTIFSCYIHMTEEI
jgi:hypothetical protein